MKKSCILFLLVIFLLSTMSGCSTIADARKAKGRGMSRDYNARFETVWATVPKALNELGLSIAGENREEGYVLAQKGLTAFSYGENVAIFVEKVDEEHTRVEIVSKKTMATNVFAFNWEKPFHDKLSEMLEKI